MGEITVLNGEEEICERKEDEAGHCIMREEMGKMWCDEIEGKESNGQFIGEKRGKEKKKKKKLQWE